MKYNYWNLSDIEFEELSLDILYKKEWFHFDVFKKGKDGGIDLLYSKPKDKWGKEIIVQCKHYFNSTYSVLKSDLLKDTKWKKSELTKIKKLNQNTSIERYILICSIELNNKQKQELIDWFEWFIKSKSDIISLNNIESLIDQEIEKRNFKLWFNSYTVIENSLMIMFKEWLNKWVKNRSDFTRKEILNDLQTFVAIPKINEAIKSLKDNNVVIISGEPWIWKTTLAKVLLVPYFDTNKSFDFIEISKDIEEWFELYDSERNQIFYYDDFLWRIAYQWENKNEAKRINQFIDKIIKSKNKKLIFTTREYILKEAEEKEDEFNLKWLIEDNKMLININDYWLLIKWKILYNHIYFSNLEKCFTEQIFKDKNYLKIIQHKNYSPRLIEQFTKKEIINNDNILSEGYIDFILSSLDNPEKIRKTWFINFWEITKKLLIILKLYEYGVTESELHKNINKYLWYELDYISFKSYLKVIEGSFISFEKKKNYNRKKWLFIDDTEYKIYYKNPSVWDFILKDVIEKDLSLVNKLIVHFISKEELYDFLNRYFRDNIEIKKIFTEKYLQHTKEEGNMYKKIELYLNIFNDYYYLFLDAERIKEIFQKYINEVVFDKYDIIEDKSIFLNILDIYYYDLMKFDYFVYEEDWLKDLDRQVVTSFKNQLEDYIIYNNLYLDKEILNKVCFFMKKIV